MNSKNIIHANDFKGIYRANKGKIVKNTEESEQESLLKWIKIVYPDVFYTVDLAGMNLSPAQRKVHRTRRKRGHPDLMFQEWYKNLYCGLAIEFKKIGTILNESKFKGRSKEAKHLREQRDYIMGLRSRGHIAGFVCGRLNAEKVIKHYLEAGPQSLKVINQLIYPKMKFNHE